MRINWLCARGFSGLQRLPRGVYVPWVLLQTGMLYNTKRVWVVILTQFDPAVEIQRQCYTEIASRYDSVHADERAAHAGCEHP